MQIVTSNQSHRFFQSVLVIVHGARYAVFEETAKHVVVLLLSCLPVTNHVTKKKKKRINEKGNSQKR